MPSDLDENPQTEDLDADHSDGAVDVGSDSDATTKIDPLVEEGDIAGDYLERLLDILDLDGDIDLDVEGSRAIVAVDGGELSHLVGARGQTLDALQELTRLAVTAKTGNRSRLMLDIDGYRAGRRVALSETANQAAQEVITSGAPNRLSPMNSFERKIVHDAIAGIDGVTSESDGEDPNRRVVVKPA
ncbi:MAG: R3H domain-containing nucleic acid-binding protein [Antricoccus sp.]